MYKAAKLGANTSAPSTPRWSTNKIVWIGLPILGWLIGDYMGAGKLRPYLVLPHKRYRDQRAAILGGAAGTAAGLAAAYLATGGDIKSAAEVAGEMP